MKSPRLFYFLHLLNEYLPSSPPKPNSLFLSLKTSSGISIVRIPLNSRHSSFLPQFLQRCTNLYGYYPLATMNKENGESGDNVQLVPLATWRTSLGRVFEYYVDRAAPHTARRWLVTLVLAMIYVDPELEGLDGVSFAGKSSDEHRPFERRLPEFRFWYFVTKAIIVSLLLTFISLLDVPVYWHIYLCYWIFLFVVTMMHQIVHMIKYKYNPFTLGCQNTIGQSHQDDQQRS